jgi:hypothetical protein
MNGKLVVFLRKSSFDGTITSARHLLLLVLYEIDPRFYGVKKAWKIPNMDLESSILQYERTLPLLPRSL